MQISEVRLETDHDQISYPFINEHQLLACDVSKIISPMPSPEDPLPVGYYTNIQHGPSVKLLKVPDKHELEQVPPENENVLTCSMQPCKIRKSRTKLEKKFDAALELYEAEQFGACQIKFITIELQVEYMLKYQKLKYHIRKRLLVLAIQLKYYRSQIYRRENKTEEAARLMEECLRTYIMNDQRTLLNITLELAVLQLSLMRFNKALDIFNRLLIRYEQLNWKPEISNVLSYMALIYAFYQQYDEAIAMAKEALLINRSTLSIHDLRTKESYYFLGYVYYLSKDMDSALVYLEFAVPHDLRGGDFTIKALNLLAQVQHIKCMHVESVKTFEKALEMSDAKHQAGLYNNIGLVLMELKKYGEARKAFVKSNALKGDKSEAIGKAIKNLKLMVTNNKLKQ